jgi:hypothetical protein
MTDTRKWLVRQSPTKSILMDLLILLVKGPAFDRPWKPWRDVIRVLHVEKGAELDTYLVVFKLRRFGFHAWRLGVTLPGVSMS